MKEEPAANLDAKDDLLNRRRILALRFGAAALVGFGLVEAAVEGVSLGRVVVRLCWGVVALLVAQGLSATNHRTRSWLLMGLGLVSPGFYAALLHFSGNTSGVAFASFLATPIIFAVLLRGEVAVAATVALANLVAGLALLAFAGTQGVELGQWAIALSTAGAMAIYAAVLHRSIMNSERSMNEERLRALNVASERDRERMRAEGVALLGQLAAGLAHEINNPLGVISLRSGIIAHAVKAVPEEFRPKDLAKHMQGITQSVAQIAGVIRELGAVVPRNQESTSCDLVAVVRATIEPPPSPRLIIHNALPAQLPQVRASEGQLRRILEHLMMSVCVDKVVSPEVWFSGTVEDKAVLLTFEDNGPALWSKTRPDAATQLATEGQRGASSGIGFALIRESLHQWGGSLTISARAGGGACVTLRLPLAPQSSSAATP